ncbi:hypothetical protein ACB092_04G008700 [Castanea dentata]
MAHNTSLVIALLHIFALSFLNVLEISNGSEYDISCLRSINESLEDPYNKFKHSWNFGNTTIGSMCKFIGVTCWNFDDNRIIGIELGNMRLKGQFPLGIRNCSYLNHLNLSGNELTCTIPSNISYLFGYATTLDLSSNNFSAEIPKGVVNCTYLNALRLENNQLTGLIPPELVLLHRIKKLQCC